MKYCFFAAVVIILFSCSEREDNNFISVSMQSSESFIYNEQTGATMLDICMFNNGQDIYKINFRNKFSKPEENYTNKFVLQNKISNKFIDLESMELRLGQHIEPGHFYCFRYATIDKDIPNIYRVHKGVFNLKAFRKYYDVYFINHRDTMLVK